MQEKPILEVQNLHKTYKNGVEAVRGLSFRLREGICFGILGPNGAGKTTTIEICEGLQEPTSGNVFFRSQPLGKEFKQKSGIQFQNTALQDFLKVGEILSIFSKFYLKTIPLEQIKDIFKLNDIWSKDHRKLSGGQRQRLLLAVAFINDPDIIFLDEPTTGLDPAARRDFWDLIRLIKSKNKTIVLTTHYMEEAQLLCDELIVVDKGKIIEEGSPQTLIQKYFPNSINKNLEDVFLKLTGRGLSV